jgi:hypothetical protein
MEGKMYLEQIDMKFISPGKMELNLTGMLNGKAYSGFQPVTLLPEYINPLIILRYMRKVKKIINVRQKY